MRLLYVLLIICSVMFALIGEPSATAIVTVGAGLVYALDEVTARITDAIKARWK